MYLDESGDLGWKFDAPYRRGGSSRYLTIATLIVPKEKRHLSKRVMRNLYKKFKWSPSIERKWADMNKVERVTFAKEAFKLRAKHPDIKYFSITVKKEKVQEHIKKDPNKLYNYMIKLSLIGEMKCCDKIEFVPDPRSIKVESGNSLHDYLQTILWFEYDSKTELITIPQDSAANLNVQFADMLSGIIQNHFEDTNTHAWSELSSMINFKKLYF